MKIFETNEWTEQDLKQIMDVVKSGDIGFGKNVALLENKYRDFSNKKFNIATNSASASAYMIFNYLYEKYGQCDVYTSSLSFTSPAWSAKHLGHNLIFVDVNNELQFCSNYYKSIRKNTGNKIVVMPVLYGGISTINDFSLHGDEIVVLDSAHCATPKLKADYVFFSFHPYKPICASDGGMLSTNIEDAARYFSLYRNFGRIPNENTYDINQNGFKFYMNNLNATMALTQIDKYEYQLAKRKENFNILKEKFELLSHDKYSSFYFATCLTEDADKIIKETGLSRHYPMLHKTQYYSQADSLPNLESLHGKILNLPLYRKF